MKKFLKKKWVKRTIIVGVVIAILVYLGDASKMPANYRTAVVESGDVRVTVSGTGTVMASESRKEVSKVSARVEEIFFDEGENVRAGDVIAKLDSSDYKITVDSQKKSLQQAQISKNTTERQIKDLKIVSNSDGFVNNLNILEGSYVVSNTKICDITVPNKYEITLQFLASDTNKIDVGNYASIFLVNSFSYVDGVVTYVSTGKKILENGGHVVDVIITVDNPDYVLEGLTANATITTSTGAKLTSTKDALFTNVRSSQILSGSTGTVTKLLVKNGSEVKKGDVIAELENRDLLASIQSSELSVQNLANQLSYSQDKLEDYAISASIDGTITSQNIKVGDWVGAGTLISTVSNMDRFEFLVPIDELDISQVSKESKVLVSIDALPETLEKPIEGNITKLSLEGVTVGGVTDYYATVSIPYVEGLRISMNASADIVISESTNVMRIPVECLIKEDGKCYVEVLNGDVPEKREVIIGNQNTSFCEIVSGLTVGEEVIVPTQMSIHPF